MDTGFAARWVLELMCGLDERFRHWMADGVTLMLDGNISSRPDCIPHCFYLIAQVPEVPLLCSDGWMNFDADSSRGQSWMRLRRAALSLVSEVNRSRRCARQTLF